MTKNSKVVAYQDSLAQKARDILAARPDIMQMPFAQHASHEHFLAYLKENPQINALILGGQRVGPAEVPVSPGLEVVARIGVGYDMIDIPSLAPRRIPLMTAGTANSPSVAEEAFALLFALIKRARDHGTRTRAANWTP